MKRKFDTADLILILVGACVVIFLLTLLTLIKML